MGTPDQKAPDPKHPLEDIEAAMQAKGLQKAGQDENPGLLVGFSVGSKQVFVIQGYTKNPLVKQALS